MPTEAKSHSKGNGNTQVLARLLAMQPLAEGLDRDALNLLLSTSSWRRLEEAQFLFYRNEPADRFYIVLEGALKLYRLSGAGVEKVIDQVGVGDSFAEEIVFMDRPHYPVNAQAIRASRVAGLPRTMYRQLLRASPETCMAIMQQLTRRINYLIDEVESLSLYDSRERVIRFLLSLVPESERGTSTTMITLPMRKSIIAAQLAIRPETFSRVLGELIRAGLIRRAADPNQLQIRDSAALRRRLGGAIQYYKA
jgi:CRP-like cAMP-binding protein